ncbi:hypothetical protein ACIRRH_22970 [Kitasatospora sp. NPDC101235]|uniref:hypothetical protein n=1 Tax=Kitasatospora sp. NPDC101235 TaxID=3364101 RepID=UPI003800E4F8
MTRHCRIYRGGRGSGDEAALRLRRWRAEEGSGLLVEGVQERGQEFGEVAE